VAVACEACDWAIGTDTGGSIRIPAALCGVVGVKPSLGTLPLAGVVPLAPSLDTVGPMARDVATAARALEVLSDGAIPFVGGIDGPPPALAVPTGWIDRLDAQVEAAFAQFAGLPEVELPRREALADPALAILQVEASRFHAGWLEEDDSRYSDDLRSKLRAGLAVPDAARDDAVAALPALREAVESAMEGLDALVVPTTACVAPLVGEREPRDALTRFTRPFNATGQPVVALPLPVPEGGLPVGVQLVGRCGEDAALLRRAAWVEAALREEGRVSLS
jgi:Asp-tRNA(Asn)/Glu-tRNA(Gln) amidotransferase A subunit family amidase